jgi:hypothetical protein
MVGFLILLGGVDLIIEEKQGTPMSNEVNNFITSIIHACII